ncbi:Glutamate--tRNA ligase [Rickettsiales bacterium Ac37b]|nr:Glutamate--tRNA ligase [Rickettsiales bacterium Ac37b]
MVVTRFAPSPTGFLHIGGARTALFNYLFAKHNNGKFLLRIEDTDQERNSKQAIEAILEGLSWLGLSWDGDVIYQSSRINRHLEVAHTLIAEGKAYYCYMTPEELSILRDETAKLGKQFRYDGRWRDRDPSEAPEGINPAIRLKVAKEGRIVINDKVQGQIITENSELDDMILVRSDGTPTYMFAVVVDDHDMGITHIIRGDDHLTNASRQEVLYQALGWNSPTFAHIPLIHGPDGSKLSKRHGALGVEAYRDMGYIPEALRNYLLRLGWSHGNDEIISTLQAIEWFNLESIGQSPARLDLKKLDNINAHYLKNSENIKLIEFIQASLEEKLGYALNCDKISTLELAMNGLKIRAKNLNELADNAFFYVADLPLQYSEKAAQIMTEDAKILLNQLTGMLQNIDLWAEENLHNVIKDYASNLNIKLGDIAQIIRVALTGSTTSPSVFEIMSILGKAASLERLQLAIKQKL